MQEKYRNIYKTARQTAGLTQERWAETLDVSVESVRLYETDRGLPSDDVVARMVEVSVLPVLGYWHLLNKSKMAAQLLPTIKILPLPQAVIQLICRMQDFQSRHRTDALLHIAEDGQVDISEQALFGQIVDELETVIQAAIALKFAKGGSVNEDIG